MEESDWLRQNRRGTKWSERARGNDVRDKKITTVFPIAARAVDHDLATPAQLGAPSFQSRKYNRTEEGKNKELDSARTRARRVAFRDWDGHARGLSILKNLDLAPDR